MPSLVDRIERALFEETEDEYVARNKTGFISSDFYKHLDTPASTQKDVSECPIIIGTMELKGPVDALAGNDPKGRSYKNIHALARKIYREVSKFEVGSKDLYLSSGYPEWFQNVYFQYQGRQFMLRNQNKHEVERNHLNLMMTCTILGEIYDIHNAQNIVTRTEDPTEGRITFRQTGEKLRYCIPDDADGNVVRDKSGNAVMMSDEEIRDRKLPITDTTVYAFDGPHCVGYASNEFGAVGVFVERNYQRQGIGKMLLHLYQRQWDKPQKLGQMTNAGERLTRSYYRDYLSRDA